jgi:hypothetical protein
MLNKVHIHWDNLDSTTWTCEEVGDVLKYLVQKFGAQFPDSARIYHGCVSQLTDVTPHSDDDIAKLAAMQGDFFVIVYPEGAALPYLVMLVIAVGVSMLMPTPSVPVMPAALNRNQQSSSPNNELSDRSNRARINGRIPDIYGTVRSTPDLIAAPYKIFENNREVEYAHMCIGRGAYNVWDVRDGETSLEFVGEAALGVYPPYASVNSYNPANPSQNAPQLVIGDLPRVPMLNTKRCNSVNGQVLRPPVNVVFGPQSPVRFVYPNRIEMPGSASADFTAFFASGDSITLSDAANAGGSQVLRLTIKAAANDVVYYYPGGSHVFDVGGGALLFPAELKDTLDQVFYPTATVDLVTNSVTSIGSITGTYGVVSVEIDGPVNPTEVQNGVPSYYIVRLSSPESVNSNWNNFFTSVPTYNADITYTSGFAFDLNGVYSVNSVSKSVLILNNPASENSDWETVLSVNTATNFINAQIASTGDRWIGPFVLDGAENTEVFSNFFAQNGLYRDDGTTQYALNVYVEIELTSVDASNAPLSSPQYYSIGMLGSEFLKESVGVTLKARPTGFYGRMLIRARRITPPVTDAGTIVDEVRWKDVYSVAPVNVNDFGNVTTVFSVTPATASALAVKDRKLNMLVQRKIPSWNGSGFSNDLTATNDAAAILSAICLDRYIGNRSVAELDVQNIYDTCSEIESYFGTPKAREFSYTFDKDNLSFEEMVSSVAGAIFCVAYRRGNVIKINVERETELSTLLFNHRNKIPKSERRTFSFGYSNDNDGIKYSYVDPADDSINTIFLPENYAAISAKNIDSVGVRDHLHAYFHAWRAWNKLRFQNTTVEFEATQEAELLVINDRILVSDGTRPYSQEGEVLAVNGNELTLSQKVDLNIYYDYSIFLQLYDGTVESIPITAGTQENQVFLESAPLLPLVTNYESYAKTTYIIVGEHQTAQAFLVSERTVSGKMTSNVSAINYDERYYANDSDYINGVITGNGYGPQGGYTGGSGSGFPSGSTVTQMTAIDRVALYQSRDGAMGVSRTFDFNNPVGIEHSYQPRRIMSSDGVAEMTEMAINAIDGAYAICCEQTNGASSRYAAIVPYYMDENIKLEADWHDYPFIAGTDFTLIDCGLDFAPQAVITVSPNNFIIKLQAKAPIDHWDIICVDYTNPVDLNKKTIRIELSDYDLPGYLFFPVYGCEKIAYSHENPNEACAIIFAANGYDTEDVVTAEFIKVIFNPSTGVVLSQSLIAGGPYSIDYAYNLQSPLQGLTDFDDTALMFRQPKSAGYSRPDASQGKILMGNWSIPPTDIIYYTYTSRTLGVDNIEIYDGLVQNEPVVGFAANSVFVKTV